MAFSQILVKLMEERKISAYKLWKETGVPQSVISRWKWGKAEPSSENMAMLANYFEVTTDYLFGNETKKELVTKSDELSIEQKYFLSLLKQLSPEQVSETAAWMEDSIRNQ